MDRFSALQSYDAESARLTLARGWDRSKQPDAPIRLLGASQQPGGRLVQSLLSTHRKRASVLCGGYRCNSSRQPPGANELIFQMLD